MQIQQECEKLLSTNGIDIDSSIDFNVNGDIRSLSFGYILETFMQASAESQLVFYAALQKALQAEEMGVEKFFEGMGQLLLLTHLSEKFQTE